MELVASVTKFKNATAFIEWLSHLPRKYSVDTIENMIKIAKKAKYIMWTEKHGVKLLK